MGDLRRKQEESGCKVYVEGIPPGVDEATFQSVFRAFGTIQDVQIFPPKQFTHSYAFVTFTTPLEASAAINFMDGFDFAGQKLRCKVAQPRGANRNQVGVQVPKTTFNPPDNFNPPKREEPRGGWSQQQANTQGFIMPNQQPVQMTQATPEQRYPDASNPRSDTSRVIGTVNPTNYMDGGPSVPEGANVLYVKGLPVGMTEDMITVIFGPYGLIDHVKVLVAKNNPLASNDTVALVNMVHAHEAKWIVDHLNGNIPEGLNAPVGIKFADTPEMKAARQRATGIAPQHSGGDDRDDRGGGYGRSDDRGGGRDGPYERRGNW